MTPIGIRLAYRRCPTNLVLRVGTMSTSGQIAEAEAEARGLTEHATLDAADDGTPMCFHESGVYWIPAASLSDTPQPEGWSGGVPPGGWS